MSKAGDFFENPVTGEAAIVRIGTEETDGELLIADLYIAPGGAVMGEHYHPGMEERFTLARGWRTIELVRSNDQLRRAALFALEVP
jgi:hypothetical protein